MSRYIPSGKAKVVFAPSVSNIAAPTQAEINAGTVLTVAGGTAAAGLFAMDGWSTEDNPLEVPDTQSRHTGTIPGRTSPINASIEFYDDDASSTIRTALAEGTAGYMIIMRNGQLATRPAEVYPCTVSTLNTSPVNSENKAAMFTTTFAVSSAPNKVAVQAA